MAGGALAAASVVALTPRLPEIPVVSLATRLIADGYTILIFRSTWPVVFQRGIDHRLRQGFKQPGRRYRRADNMRIITLSCRPYPRTHRFGHHAPSRRSQTGASGHLHRNPETPPGAA